MSLLLLAAAAHAAPIAPAFTRNPDCDDPAAPAAQQRAADAWRVVGLPPDTSAVVVVPGRVGPISMVAYAVDDHRQPLGSITFDTLCAVAGWEVDNLSVSAPFDSVPVPLRPASTPKAALVAGWIAGAGPLAAREDLGSDVLYAVRSERGWDVWFTRNGPDGAYTIGVVSVLADGSIGGLRLEVRPWTPPDKAYSRAAAAFRGIATD